MKTYGMWETLRLALVNTLRQLAPLLISVVVILVLWLLTR